MEWTHKKLAIGLLGCSLITIGAWWIVSPKQLAVTNMQSAPTTPPELGTTAYNLEVTQQPARLFRRQPVTRLLTSRLWMMNSAVFWRAYLTCNNSNIAG